MIIQKLIIIEKKEKRKRRNRNWYERVWREYKQRGDENGDELECRFWIGLVDPYQLMGD